MASNVLCIMGPTGVGKTALAMALAQALPVDIISVDSAMIYRGMAIGTAKPSLAEQAVAPHQLIDVCDPCDTYSVAQFCDDAKQAIDLSLAQGRVPLLVGGTMMYVHRLQHGIAALPDVPEVIRQQVAEMVQRKGCGYLYERLQSIDPALTARVHCHDAQRLARGMEVYLATGQSLSHWQSIQQCTPSAYRWCQIAIVPEDRAVLHKRLDLRFEQMIKDGLEQELVGLLERFDLHGDRASMRCVGYRQMLAYLQGEIAYPIMISKAQAATRQLAKRQLTWLRSWPGLHVLQDTEANLYDKVLAHAQQCHA